MARDYFKVVGTHWLSLIYIDRVARSWHPGAPLRLTGIEANTYLFIEGLTSDDKP
jgi:hypothetical protein